MATAIDSGATTASNEPGALPLVYADDALLAFDKPAGLLCVPGRGANKQDCLSARAQAVYPDALVVHRLDQATSGLVLMARGLEMQQQLNRAFSEREVHKRYVAVVSGLCGAAGDDWHTIDLPIVVDWPRRPLRIIDAALGKPSVTRWRCVAQDTEAHTSRLELEPVTGRSHQLRVHLQAIGHPILGDALYAYAAGLAASARLLLHAHTLRLTHPATGAPLHLESPCPF